jgi:hypothetical protein
MILYIPLIVGRFAFVITKYRIRPAGEKAPMPWSVTVVCI